MSLDSKTVTIVSLNGANYPTWKVQCNVGWHWWETDYETW